jgi:hypothetical protein
MKKNFLSILFLILCLGMCLSLSIGILFAGPAQAGANEQLTEFPVLRSEEGGWNPDYLTQLSTWLRDHFFLRQELISLDHRISAALFHTSGDSGVVLGSQGWLYYTDTLADYTGTNPMTQRELFAAANNLRLMAEYSAEQGRDFAFMIAPNKNSLYDACMPNYGQRADETDAERLMALLAENGVPTVDLFTAFRQEADTLYFAHDSHWNTKGAALGADLINAAFGVESSYYQGDFSQKLPHDGDLYAMLYPAFTDPETDFVYGGQLNYEFTTSATRPDAIVLNTQGSGDKDLLVYRDSFGILLFPFLADSFSAARFSRSTAYDLTYEADCILVELVERNLRYLIQNLPTMPAPQATPAIPDTVSGSICVTAKERGDWLQVKGQLPETDENSPIYVICGDTAYEAFCLEQNSFGLSLAPESVPEYAVCMVDGAPVMFNLEINK